mgnify:CR=1 FL=1
MDFVKRHLFWLIIVAVLIVEFVLYIVLVVMPGSVVEDKKEQKKEIDSSEERIYIKARGTPNRKWLERIKSRENKIQERIQKLKAEYASREKFFETFWGRTDVPDPADFRNQYFKETRKLIQELTASGIGLPEEIQKNANLDEFTLENAKNLGFKDWGEKIPEKTEIPRAMKEFYIIRTIASILTDPSLTLHVQSEKAGSDGKKTDIVIKPEVIERIEFKDIVQPKVTIEIPTVEPAEANTDPMGGVSGDPEANAYLQGAQAATGDSDEKPDEEYLIRPFDVTIEMPYPLIESVLYKIEKNSDLFFVVKNVEAEQKSLNTASLFGRYPSVKTVWTIHQYDFSWAPWKNKASAGAGENEKSAETETPQEKDEDAGVDNE